MEGRRENHQRRIRAQLEMRQGEIWVAVLRGAVHNTVGYTKQRQGKIFVRPEEALFLVEVCKYELHEVDEAGVRLRQLTLQDAFRDLLVPAQEEGQASLVGRVYLQQYLRYRDMRTSGKSLVAFRGDSRPFSYDLYPANTTRRQREHTPKVHQELMLTADDPYFQCGMGWQHCLLSLNTPSGEFAKMQATFAPEPVRHVMGMKVAPQPHACRPRRGGTRAPKRSLDTEEGGEVAPPVSKRPNTRPEGEWGTPDTE